MLQAKTAFRTLIRLGVLAHCKVKVPLLFSSFLAFGGKLLQLLFLSRFLLPLFLLLLFFMSIRCFTSRDTRHKRQLQVSHIDAQAKTCFPQDDRGVAENSGLCFSSSTNSLFWSNATGMDRLTHSGISNRGQGTDSLLLLLVCPILDALTNISRTEHELYAH